MTVHTENGKTRPCSWDSACHLYSEPGQINSWDGVTIVGEQHTSLKAVFSLSDSILTIEWADIHRTLTPHDSRREQTRKQLTTTANLELTRNYNQLQVIVLIAKSQAGT